MKNIIVILIFFISPYLIAENNSNFEIEGVSLGQNLLAHYNKTEINNAYSYKYKNDKFRYYVFALPTRSKYDYLQITVKTEYNLKNNFPIHSISGIIICRNDIETCFIKQNELRKELYLLFKQDPIKTNGNHNQYKKQISYWENFSYFLSNSRYPDVNIIRYDNSKELEDQGRWDYLELTISSQEFRKFINEEVFK